jgi:riboflavin kinase/FMN adenylyltransferase
VIGSELVGTVVPGDQRGRTIGFPTANIAPAAGDAVPPRGVYAALADGRPAAVNIGLRPTFVGTEPTIVIEVHLLDFAGDLYGREMRLKFVSRLRDERTFDTADLLVEQLKQDVLDVRAAVTQASPNLVRPASP